MSDLIDDIKVEVQLPPEEGDNLLTNTSGQYGAWQWGTGPFTTGYSITGDPVARTIQVLRGPTQGLTNAVSDWVPVTPGKYVNVRIDIVSLTSGHEVELMIQFGDTPDPQAILGGVAGAPANVPGTHAFSSVLVPAGQPYMRLQVRLRNLANDFTHASANAEVTFTKAMVSETSTAGTPSETVTNLVPNGGFESSTITWQSGSNVRGLERPAQYGEYWLQANLAYTTFSTGEYAYVNGPTLNVEAGERYSIEITSEMLPLLFTDREFTHGLMYRWYDASDAQLGANNYVTTGNTSGATQVAIAMATAPAGAVTMRIYGFARHLSASFSHTSAHNYNFGFNDVSVVKSNSRVEYFDGDTPDTSSTTYEWTGTVRNSPSTRSSVGAVPYVEPDEQWIDITGGYNQFTIERDELDLSTMNGVIVDPALSPARADSVITPGRGVRVSAYRPELDAFDRLFTGTLGPCTVEYDPLNDDKRQKVRINVTSTGRESALAQASRPGVALVAADLPAVVLQQAGVPWVVDGSTGITPAASVADNDNSTALDQIGLTRDTVAGIAWVDPEGTLRFETTPSAKSTGPNTIGPADYSAAGLKVGFSTDNLINSVNVTRLIRASDGSTEERVAGQTFEDFASVRQWGRHSYPLTIASLPNDVADAETAAMRILAANAFPEIVIDEIAINSADDRAHAFHDLYDLVTVTADTIDGEVVKDQRIARIKHELTVERRPGGQGRWRTTYGFKVEGVVAAPSTQPPLGSPEGDGWIELEKNNPSASMANVTLEYRITGRFIEFRITGSLAESVSIPASGDNMNQNVTTGIPAEWRPQGNWAWPFSAGRTGFMYVTPGGNITWANSAGDAGTVASGQSIAQTSPAFLLP